MGLGGWGCIVSKLFLDFYIFFIFTRPLSFVLYHGLVLFLTAFISMTSILCCVATDSPGIALQVCQFPQVLSSQQPITVALPPLV